MGKESGEGEWGRRVGKESGEGEWGRRVGKESGEGEWGRRVGKESGEGEWGRRVGKESGEGEWGAVWTVSSPKNNRMGVLLKKMSFPGFFCFFFVEKLQRGGGHTCVSVYAYKCLHYDSTK